MAWNELKKPKITLMCLLVLRMENGKIYDSSGTGGSYSIKYVFLVWKKSSFCHPFAVLM